MSESSDASGSWLESGSEALTSESEAEPAPPQWTMCCKQAPALQAAMDNPGTGLRIWASDWPKRDSNTTSKRFFTETQEGMDLNMKSMRTEDRIFFEMLVVLGVPPSCAACRLFFDCEYEHAYLTPAQLEAMPDNLTLSKMIVRNILAYVRTIPGLSKTEATASVRILDASRAGKFSLHLIFVFKTLKDGREIVFKDVRHVGALVRTWHLGVEQTLPWIIPKKVPKDSPPGTANPLTCVVDLGVYTVNRQMRLAANTKLNQARPLLAIANNVQITEQQTLERWQHFLIQDHSPELFQRDTRLILETTEADGGEPVSTSVGFAQMRASKSRNRTRGPDTPFTHDRERDTKRPRSSRGYELPKSTGTALTDDRTVFHPSQTMFAPCALATLAEEYALEETGDLAADLKNYTRLHGPFLQGQGMTLRLAMEDWVAKITGDSGAYAYRCTPGSPVCIRCPNTHTCHPQGSEHRSNHGYMTIDVAEASARYHCGDNEAPCNKQYGIRIQLPLYLILHMYVATEFVKMM